MAPRYDIPKAAPEPLRQLQLFVNTIDVHRDAEWLSDWLEARGVAGEYERARQLREALRSLLVANSGGVPDAAAVSILNRALARLSLSLDSKGRVGLECAGDPLDDVVCIAARAMLDGSWERLKACPNCRWCFYDYSPNRSALWCSMQLCGNRKKTREYRRRTRTRRTS